MSAPSESVTLIAETPKISVLFKSIYCWPAASVLASAGHATVTVAFVRVLDLALGEDFFTLAKISRVLLVGPPEIVNEVCVPSRVTVGDTIAPSVAAIIHWPVFSKVPDVTETGAVELPDPSVVTVYLSCTETSSCLRLNQMILQPQMIGQHSY